MLQISSGTVLALVTAWFFFRMPRALRARFAPTPAPRKLPPAWVATGYAAVGLLTLGLVWPSSVLDRALPLFPGQNLVNLLEALTATAGFWYVRDAMRLYGLTERPGQFRWLVLMCGTQTVCFLAIPAREGPTETFIDQHLISWACWGYMSIYMLCVLLLSLTAIRAVWARRREVPARLFIVGFTLVSFAAVVDLGYSLAGHLAGYLTPLGAVLFGIFVAAFYPGMLTVIVGYMAPGIERATWHGRCLVLEQIAGRPATFGGLRQQLRDPDPLDRAYRLLIELQNQLLRGELVLTGNQNARFARIERRLARSIFIPTGRFTAT